MNKDKNEEVEYEVKEPEVWVIREGAEQEYGASQLFTYEDYCTWSDEERWELIDGKAFRMEAPNRYHQKISATLFGEIYIHLKGKKCEAYHAPFDVKLNVGEGKDTVVQPDILVVCDQEKLDDKGAKGAPDLVIEILSRDTAKHDRVRKYQKYEQYGVKEYWIVDPRLKIITVNLLNNQGKSEAKEYIGAGAITSTSLSDFNIGLETIFADKRSGR